MTSEETLRKDVIRYGKLMSDRRLTFATGGNISTKLDEGSMLITPSGVRKGDMRKGDLIVVSLEDGSWEGKLRPSIETPLHTVLYRTGEIMAVVHGHPPFCTALAVAGVPLLTRMVPEGVIMLGDVPLIPYRTPGTRDLADALVNAGGDGRGYLMERHGAITVGNDLEQAFNRLEEMEFLAEVQVRTMSLGGARELPPEEVKRILDI